MNGRVQQEERKAGKTLIFGFDGTGNDPSDANAFMEDESISNVLKLHILMGGGLQSDRSDTRTPNGSLQVTHYYNGIGTREGGASVPLLGRLIRAVGGKINMAFAPTFGDARRILNEARADLRKAGCREDDRLLVFGFSRGAALARKFTSEILAGDEKCTVSFLGRCIWCPWTKIECLRLAGSGQIRVLGGG